MVCSLVGTKAYIIIGLCPTEGESASMAMASGRNVAQDFYLHYAIDMFESLGSFEILVKELPQESKGRCANITKKLAGFKCAANASRDFYKWVKLPLDASLNQFTSVWLVILFETRPLGFGFCGVVVCFPRCQQP